MNAILSISCEELSEEALQDFTFEMINTINSETNLTASIIKGAGKPGGKGDLPEWGKILIELGKIIPSISGLLTVIKSYIDRKPSPTVTIITESGEKIVIKNLSDDQFKLFAERLNKAIGA
jgi:hypothetical protein